MTRKKVGIVRKLGRIIAGGISALLLVVGVGSLAAAQGPVPEPEPSATLVIDGLSQPYVARTGQTVVFGVSSQGFDPDYVRFYRWSISRDGGRTWTNPGFCFGSKPECRTYFSAPQTIQMKVKVSANADSAISNIVTLTVKQGYDFRFTNNPAPQNVMPGQKAVFTTDIDMHGADPDQYRVLWQQRKHGDSGPWAAAEGQTSDDGTTLTVTAFSELNDMDFRAVVYDMLVPYDDNVTVAELAETEPALLTIATPQVRGISDTHVAYGQVLRLAGACTGAGPGAGPGYSTLWQYSTDGGDRWVDVGASGAGAGGSPGATAPVEPVAGAQPVSFTVDMKVPQVLVRMQCLYPTGDRYSPWDKYVSRPAVVRISGIPQDPGAGGAEPGGGDEPGGSGSGAGGAGVVPGGMHRPGTLQPMSAVSAKPQVKVVISGRPLVSTGGSANITLVWMSLGLIGGLALIAGRKMA